MDNNQKKIMPGCEKLTKPEEISALKDYLKQGIQEKEDSLILGESSPTLSMSGDPILGKVDLNSQKMVLIDGSTVEIERKMVNLEVPEGVKSLGDHLDSIDKNSRTKEAGITTGNMVSLEQGEEILPYEKTQTLTTNKIENLQQNMKLLDVEEKNLDVSSGYREPLSALSDEESSLSSFFSPLKVEELKSIEEKVIGLEDSREIKISEKRLDIEGNYTEPKTVTLFELLEKNVEPEEELVKLSDKRNIKLSEKRVDINGPKETTLKTTLFELLENSVDPSEELIGLSGEKVVSPEEGYLKTPEVNKGNSENKWVGDNSADVVEISASELKADNKLSNNDSNITVVGENYSRKYKGDNNDLEEKYKKILQPGIVPETSVVPQNSDEITTSNKSNYERRKLGDNNFSISEISEYGNSKEALPEETKEVNITKKNPSPNYSRRWEKFGDNGDVDNDACETGDLINLPFSDNQKINLTAGDDPEQITTWNGEGVVGVDLDNTKTTSYTRNWFGDNNSYVEGEEERTLDDFNNPETRHILPQSDNITTWAGEGVAIDGVDLENTKTTSYTRNWFGDNNSYVEGEEERTLDDFNNPETRHILPPQSDNYITWSGINNFDLEGNNSDEEDDWKSNYTKKDFGDNNSSSDKSDLSNYINNIKTSPGNYRKSLSSNIKDSDVSEHNITLWAPGPGKEASQADKGLSGNDLEETNTNNNFKFKYSRNWFGDNNYNYLDEDGNETRDLDDLKKTRHTLPPMPQSDDITTWSGEGVTGVDLEERSNVVGGEEKNPKFKYSRKNFGDNNSSEDKSDLKDYINNINTNPKNNIARRPNWQISNFPIDKDDPNKLDYSSIDNNNDRTSWGEASTGSDLPAAQGSITNPDSLQQLILSLDEIRKVDTETSSDAYSTLEQILSDYGKNPISGVLGGKKSGKRPGHKNRYQGSFFDEFKEAKSEGDILGQIKAIMNMKFSISPFFRTAAEAIASFIKNSEVKQDVIDITLITLTEIRDLARKGLDSIPHRLPGESDTWYGKIGSTIGTNPSLGGLANSGMGALVSLGDQYKNPVNRPQIDKETQTTKSTRWGVKGKERYFSEYLGIEDFENSGLSGTTTTNSYNTNTVAIGLSTTFEDLLPTINLPTGVSSLEDLKRLLSQSPYITTADKVKNMKMTLDSNHVWEIRLFPYLGNLNGNCSWLPSIYEMNGINWAEHRIQTEWGEWIPASSFELQSKKMTQKTLGLFDGEISYPVSMEFTNEVRITFIDDQLKTWKRYFELCAECSTYLSGMVNSIHNEEVKVITSKVDEITGRIVHNSGNKLYVNLDKTDLIDYSCTTPVVKGTICPGMYKNLSFRCLIYVMNPQMSTIQKFDLLLVMKDYAIEYTGDTDANSPDLTVSFSVVGENPGDAIPTFERKPYDVPKDDTSFWEKAGDFGLDIVKKLGTALVDVLS